MLELLYALLFSSLLSLIPDVACQEPEMVSFGPYFGENTTSFETMEGIAEKWILCFNAHIDHDMLLMGFEFLVSKPRQGQSLMVNVGHLHFTC